MWTYQKKLAFPITIHKKDLRLAKVLVTQYGGAYGELGAAIRYLNQRYTMPDDKGKSLLTDIATEELGHIEMIMTMIYQLTKGATVEEFKNAGIEGNYVEHGGVMFPNDASGVPFSTGGIGMTANPIADLVEDMAAEQKARVTYEHLMDLTTDEEVLRPLAFLRQREVVHFARFKELYEYYLSKGYK